MKKIILIMFIGLMLCGCGKENKEDVINDLKTNIQKTKSYKVTGNMEISNDEETFTYSLESYYLKDNYYKVVLVNQTNNHEQIILKNNEDIYVITPALNKSFKFQSEWPGNSSQAYLLGSLVNDIDNDTNREITEENNGYIIKTEVNYPNNSELKYQKIYLNNKKIIEKVMVFDENDIVKIKVVFDKIDMKANLKEEDFKLDKYVKEDVENDNKELVDNNDKNNNKECTGDSCQNSNDSTENNVNNANNNDNTQNNNDSINNEQKSEGTISVDNIIYPLYIPSNTYLTSSEVIDTDNGNRVILTFSGEKNFVLIEEMTIANNEMEIVPVYGEPLMLSEVIGALSANSLSWDVNNISYYLASTELSVSEMQSIANSLGNSTLVANTK